MKKNGRELIQENRKKLSLKSMYFNRYLLIRYVTALFFFTNIYWLISLLMSDSLLYLIPLGLNITMIASIIEQVNLFSNHSNNPKYTRYCFTILLFTNLLLMSMNFSSSAFSQLYPFLIEKEKSIILVLIVQMIGVILSALVLYRLYKIKHNQDKHYQRIKKYEEVIN